MAHQEWCADGATGGRSLIAKRAAVDLLRKLHAEQKAIAAVAFEDVLTTRLQHLFFLFGDGYQPHIVIPYVDAG